MYNMYIYFLFPIIALSELSDASASLPADVVPPKFTQLLKDIEGTEGELVRFDCRVIGHPTPTIKWYRGRNQIATSADFQVAIQKSMVYIIFGKGTHSKCCAMVDDT